MIPTIPPVGSHVRVKTRTFNLDGLPGLKNVVLVEKIYEGIVHKVLLDSFMVDKTQPDGTLRTFNIKDVFSVDVLDFKHALKGEVVRKFHVQSSSSKKKQYIVEVIGDEIRCSCPGWIHNRKCKHKEAMKEMLK
jgi:hypothetical protein